MKNTTAATAYQLKNTTSNFSRTCTQLFQGGLCSCFQKASKITENQFKNKGSTKNAITTNTKHETKQTKNKTTETNNNNKEKIENGKYLYFYVTFNNFFSTQLFANKN